MNEIQEVPAHLIIQGDNDRQKFDTWKLVELAANIAFYGLAQPPVLRRVVTYESGEYFPVTNDHNGLLKIWEQGDTSKRKARYEIVAGERRVRAMRDILGRETISAIVRNMNDIEASATMAAENLAREDLSPIEEAKAFQKRLGMPNIDISDLAAQVGKSMDFIKNRLKLLALPDDIQHLVGSGNMPIGHAIKLTDLDPNRQRLATRHYNQRPNMNITAFTNYVGQLQNQQIVEVQRSSTLFDLSGFETEPDIPEAIALSGKEAVTGAPFNPDLPAVTLHNSTGTMMAHYIAELLAAGHQCEAEAIGTLYTALVASNSLSVPFSNPLDETSAKAGDLAKLT